MEQQILVTLLTVAGFLAVVTSLAVKRSYSSLITGGCLLAAGIGGILLYGYGCALHDQTLPMAVLRSVMDVCYMFVGRNDYALLRDTPLCATEAGQFLFWSIHFLAFYATAGAIITTLGSRILTRLRLLLARRGDLVIICGVDEDTVSFGCSLMSRDRKVIFVDDTKSDSMENRIITAGSLLRTDNSACMPDGAFLRSIGMTPGRRNLTLYVLQPDPSRNLSYAAAMAKALENRGIFPRQTSLVLEGIREEDGGWLQAGEDSYGYGSVAAFQKPQLAARLLVQTYPPCDSITFREDGQAAEDFEALLVGFGRYGQAVLHQLVINGQFTGSSFHMTVFATDCSHVDGLLYASAPCAMDAYDIRFHEADARSREMYDFLRDRAGTLKYVVVAAGGDRINGEISGDLAQELHRLGSSAAIYECSAGGVRRIPGGGHPARKHALLQPEVLDIRKMDRMAIALNQAYCGGNGKSPLENWEACDYFSRLSSRASADFLPAVLRASGRTEEEVLAGNWELSETQKENLGRTEHLRWCAFHFMMGLRPMPAEVHQARIRQYRREVEQNGSSSLRIGKDMRLGLHACLVPWEKLDELSRVENEATGKSVDYKQMDVNNVQMLPKLLKLSRDLWKS